MDIGQKFILALDSSFDQCSVAISYGPNLIQEIIEFEPSMAATRLVNMTKDCLTRSNLEINNIDYIAVTKGPGSFTGIRIALSITQGFLIALKSVKAITLDSFEYYHYRATKQVIEFDYNMVLLDAHRAGAYISIKDKANDTLFQPKICSEEDLLDIIQKIPGNKLIVISGNCLPKFYNILNSYTNIIILPRFEYIRAKILNEIAYKKILESNFSSSLSPYYIGTINAKAPSIT